MKQLFFVLLIGAFAVVGCDELLFPIGPGGGGTGGGGTGGDRDTIIDPWFPGGGDHGDTVRNPWFPGDDDDCDTIDPWGDKDWWRDGRGGGRDGDHGDDGDEGDDDDDRDTIFIRP